MKFKHWLRQVISILKRDGILDSYDITETTISCYEDIEELFEHGLSAKLVAQVLTDDFNDKENEDRCMYNDQQYEGAHPNELEHENEDWDDDEEPEDECIFNLTSEEPNSTDDEDEETRGENKTVRRYNIYNFSITLLKSEYTLLMCRLFDRIILF